MPRKPYPSDLHTPWPAADAYFPTDPMPFPIKPGQSILLEGKPYRFTRRYTDGRLELERDGAAPVGVSSKRLRELFYAGHIELPARRGFSSTPAQQALVAVDRPTLLASVSAQSREKAERRTQYLRRLLEEDRAREKMGLGPLPISGPKERIKPVSVVSDRPSNLHELVVVVSKEIGDTQPPDWRTLRKQIQNVRDAGHVAPHMVLDGRATSVHPDRLDSRVEEILDDVFAEYLYRPVGTTADDIQSRLREKIQLFHRQTGEDLRTPSISTIYDRMRRLDGLELLRHQKGGHRARAVYRLAGQRNDTYEPLELVEFDWTPTNTYVITRESASSEKKVLVRPILGVFYDNGTDNVLGHILTTRKPSNALFLLALQRLMMPGYYSDYTKTELSIRSPIHGVPVRMLADRGVELISDNTRNALEGLGISFTNVGIKKPEDKKIESFFSIFEQFSKKLPGYSRGRALENVRADDCLTEDEYRQKVENFLYRINPLRTRRGHKLSPKQKFAHFVRTNPGWVPAQPPSKRELEIAVGVRKTVAVNNQGVRHANVHWTGEWVLKIMRDMQAHQGPIQAELIVQPHTLAYAYLVHPKTGEAGKVQCVTPRYGNSADLWSHEALVANHKKKSDQPFPEDDQARMVALNEFLTLARRVSARKVRGAGGDAVGAMRPDLGSQGSNHRTFGHLSETYEALDSPSNDNAPTAANGSGKNATPENPPPSTGKPRSRVPPTELLQKLQDRK